MTGASDPTTGLLRLGATGSPNRGGQSEAVPDGAGEPTSEAGTAVSPALRRKPVVSGDTSNTGPASTVPGVQSVRTRFGEIGAEASAVRVTGAAAGE